MKAPQGLILCFAGPAGSGKTTFAHKLLDEFAPGIKVAVSVTTRTPRPGEVDGVNYHFVDKDRFAQLLQQNQLFESEEIHGNMYGQLRTSFESAVAGRGDLMLDIDIRGALSVRKGFPGNTVVIFLLPPSAQVLKDRLEQRAPLAPGELKKRLDTAQREYQQLRESQAGGAGIDYCVVNDDLEGTYDQLRAILIAERSKLARRGTDFLDRYCVLPKV